MNLFNEASNSKFVARKWDIVNDQLNANYNVGNEIVYNTEVLKCNLSIYNDDYILVRGDIITTARNKPTPVAFKNDASFTKCIKKIDETIIDDAEDLDLSMPMYNLIEYRSNYSDTTGSF